MSFLSGVFNFLMMMFLFRAAVTIFTALRLMSRRRVRRNTAEAPKSPFLDAIEESRVFDTVVDEYCGVIVPENEAYILMEDDGPRYFHSWDCRQKYIAEKKAKG